MDPLPSPRAPALPTAPAELSAGMLVAEASLQDARADGLDLGGLSAPGLTVRGAELHAVRLAAAELESLELTDVQLTGCDLANARLTPQAGLRRVQARSCRLTGLTIGDGVLRDVSFEDCRIDLASFAGARLQRVTFTDCVLTQTDFLEAELDTVGFNACDLTELDLRGATLRRCELRGCELSAVRGVERLRGARLPWPDIVAGAGEWARALGIEVLDEQPDERADEGLDTAERPPPRR